MDGRKHSVIEAGGKIYNLRVSFNAMALFEENVGPIQMLAGKDAKTVVGFRGLIWAAINDCGTPVTLAQAGDICEDYISEQGYGGFTSKIQELIDGSGWFGKKGDDPGKNPKMRLKEPSAK